MLDAKKLLYKLKVLTFVQAIKGGFNKPTRFFIFGYLN